MIPRQEVTGEAEPKDESQEEYTEHPGDFTRLLVGTVEIGLHHMDDDDKDHQVGSPNMDLSDQPAERHRLVDVVDAVAGL